MRFSVFSAILLMGVSSSSWASIPRESLEPVASWCAEVSRAVQSLGWKVDPCAGVHWQVGGKSVQGRALVFADLGDVRAKNTTLIFSTIHGDEVTPLYVGLQIAHWIKEHQGQLHDTRVILAPLVNPDGFFHIPRTRMNARGVDVNRNFPTRDWKTMAHKAWKKKHHSDPRRFPGNVAASEPETQFQQELIRRFRPQKIMGIHSPLNFLDYDGPSALSLAKFPSEYVQQCLKLRTRLKAITTGYFPGSLGNYAGQERGIPTLTLELPSADARKAVKYWQTFSQGIKTMIEFSMPTYTLTEIQRGVDPPSGG